MSNSNPTAKHPVKVLGNYVGGEFHPPLDPNGEWTVASPANEKDLIAKIKYSYMDIDKAVEAASIAYKSWRRKSTAERIEHLSRFREILRAKEAQFCEIISRETGKPLWETKTEMAATLGKFDITFHESMKLIADLEIPDALPKTVGRSRYRPLGVMAVIGPFNFPVHLPNGHIVPALLTGNTVIFKPSERTPLSGQLYAECVHEAGIPPGVFNLLQGEKETSRRLCVHEGIAGILFTGSYEVGTRIKQDTLQQHWKILALEMGGKNATIVREDADFDVAIYETLFSAFISAGQRCSATSRVIVQDSIADRFVEALHAGAKQIRIGHPYDPVFMGPVIDAHSVDRFLKFQPIAQREGFELVMRGKQLELPTRGHYITPSLCYQKNSTAAQAKKSIYQQTELFAPNLAILSVKELDEMIAIANATSYGLVTSVFTRSKQDFDRCYDDLECGLVNWNRGTVGASSKLPFGGFKKSGDHRPTALSSVFYCTAPVASLEMPTPELPAQPPVGFSE